jgi:hypothetical protein
LDAGSGTISQSSICSLYVNCMSKTTPAGMAAILAAYGPQGSCWANAQTAATCDQACVAGLGQERKTAQFVPDCPLCATDADCVGDTPACSSGTCACAPLGHACADNAACCSGGCNDGHCGCPSGATACNGSCARTDSDTSNCGECGHACAKGESCVSGQCKCLDTCNACRNACTSSYHCGTGISGDDIPQGDCGTTAYAGGAFSSWTCNMFCQGLGAGFACDTVQYWCPPDANGTPARFAGASCSDALSNPPSNVAAWGCASYLALSCACRHSG